MIVCGIDPGLDGALAFLDPVNSRVVAMIGMPAMRLAKGKGSKREISATALVIEIEREIISRGLIVRQAYLEAASAGVWPRKGIAGPARGMGVTGAFKFGRGYGNVEGCIAAFRWPIEYVTPAKWKKAMHVPAEKDDARNRACQLMPLDAELWTPRRLVMNQEQASGRAEAALIALYGVRAVAGFAGEFDRLPELFAEAV